ncbi:hypothetical protein Tco_0745408 [Tanacetum coccineum]
MAGNGGNGNDLPTKKQYYVGTLLWKKMSEGSQGNLSLVRNGSSVGDSVMVRGPLDSILKVDHGKTKQSTLDKNNPIKQNLKMVAWKKIATWAYTVGLPFNAVRDDSFQEMIYAVGEYGKRPQWQKYGCSIMSDFWTDGKGRCLINFLVNCPIGTIFLKSIDASEHVKDAQLIVEMINEVIEDVGEENILQFITDNGSNYKAAGKILEEQHPKLFWTPCAAHCYTLCCEPNDREISGENTEIKSALVRPIRAGSCVTRFANSSFYTLQELSHENRHHLQVLFVSGTMDKSGLCNETVRKRRVDEIGCKARIFWDNVYISLSSYSLTW